MEVLTYQNSISKYEYNETYDVAVIGAGPYGLSVSSHLLDKGLRVATFGKPLELWRDHMPEGLCLRSHWWAINLSDPQNRYTIQRFFQEHPHFRPCYPLPLATFVAYGLWFQRHAVPNLDETYVSNVEHIADQQQFLLTLVDGRKITCSAVVMATGMQPHAYWPEQFQGFPEELVSHACDHANYHRFARQRVLVVGGGQGAVEHATLLYEAGAEAHLIARQPIRWLSPDQSEERSWWQKLLVPPAALAPGWRNWILEHLPYLFFYLPAERKRHYLNVHYRATVADWLRLRVKDRVILHEGVQVISVVRCGGGLQVELNDGTSLFVDHILLGTGFRTQLHNLTILSSSLRAHVQIEEHTPVLNASFESSVPGLYFVGMATVAIFGPIYRFIVGNKATARRVASAIAHRVSAFA